MLPSIVNSQSWRLRQAAWVVNGGGIVAYPTEAVYGLGCHPLDPLAVTRLLALKQRPMAKGLILIAASLESLRPYIGSLSDPAMRPVLESWPGAATWLIKATANVPYWLTGEHSTLAVRVTDHPIAAALCRAAGTPLVSTSANLSSRPPARSALQVRLRCGPGVDLILHGETGGLKRPTPIRDALSGRVIRA
ncbi:MAG: threonylcarbamoyl-AMP synthase [Candidatus Thiodiazotropha sp. (ex Codakia orbicularis)]|nr:threonylcarbamoyl-AMP synthase [Candidatus Thiodiazotropha sp. (ex Codakia orbicularis)]